MKNDHSVARFFDRLWYIHLFPFLFWFRKSLLIGLGSLILLIFLGVQFGLFRAPLSGINAFEAIPLTSTVIFETKDYQQVSQKLEQSSYQKGLQGIALTQRWQEELITLDSMLSKKPRYANILETAQLVSGAQLDGEDDFAWLYVLSNYNVTFKLAELLKDSSISLKEESTYRGQTIYQLHTDSLGDFSFCNYSSILLFSRTTSLVEAGVEQLENIGGNITNRRAFTRVRSRTGSGDLAVYVNFKSLAIFLSMLSIPASEDLRQLSQSFDWAGLDLRFQEQNFVMSGHIYPQDKQPFWKWLASQSGAAAGPIDQLIPENIAICNYLSLEGFPSYYRKRPAAQQNEDFARYILPWLGKEAAFFITEPTSSDFSADQFVVLHAKDPIHAKEKLEAYAQTFGMMDSIIYQNHSLIQLNSTQLLSNAFGVKFGKIKNPYYTIIDDYVVFASSSLVMQLWLENYNNKRTIAHSKVFKPFAGQLKDQSSYYLLLNTPNAAQLLKAYVRPELHKMVDERFLQFKQLSPVGIQLSAFKNHFLLTASIAYNEAISSSEVELAWRYELKSPAAIAPQVIKNTNSNQFDIFIQDKEHRIYLFDRSGQLRWEKALENPIISSIQEIDYYENGESQITFNTERAIYVYSHQGKEIKKIPLVSRAANGVLAIDYGKGPRFFVACKNAKVYGFDKNGKPLSGWNPNKDIGKATFPLLYHEQDKKDYMISMDNKGKLQFFRRNGKRRFRKNFKGYFLSGFYVNEDQERIAACATNGRIYVVNLKGKAFSIAPAEGIKKETHFVLADVTADKRLDYVRQSRKQLAIHAYDTAHQLQQVTRFDYPVSQDELFAIQMINENKQFIGSYAAARQQIFLIDGQGEPYPGFPLGGTTPFTVLDLFDDNRNTLLVAKEKLILAYKLK